MASNLPPGVTESMIPGNRPEDIALEAAEVGLMDMCHDAKLSPDEYMIVAQVGLAAVMAARGYETARHQDYLADDETYHEWLKSQIPEGDPK